MVNRNSSRIGRRQGVPPRRRLIRLEVGIPSVPDRNSQLGITEDQKKDWAAAQAKAKSARAKLMAGLMSKEITRDQIPSASEKIRNDFREDVQKFLNEEQMQKFDQQMKKDYKVLFPKQ